MPIVAGVRGARFAVIIHRRVGNCVVAEHELGGGSVARVFGNPARRLDFKIVRFSAIDAAPLYFALFRAGRRARLIVGVLVLLGLVLLAACNRRTAKRNSKNRDDNKLLQFNF